jgi:hypothetical protein
LGIQLATPVADMAGLLIVIPIMARVLKQISIPDGLNENAEVLLTKDPVIPNVD